MGLGEVHGATMELTLAQLLRYQAADQEERFGVHPADLLPALRVEYIREQTLGALAELHEALDETGWKPWKEEGHGEVRREAMTLELSDVLVFLLNLYVVTGSTPEQVEATVLATQSKNRKRLEEGY